MPPLWKGYKVAGVKVDGAEIPDVKAEEERGQATATVSGLAAGEHKAEVLFSLEGGGEALPAADFLPCRLAGGGAGPLFSRRIPPNGGMIPRREP